jgi:hypothetical protein
MSSDNQYTARGQCAVGFQTDPRRTILIDVGAEIQGTVAGGRFFCHGGPALSGESNATDGVRGISHSRQGYGVSGENTAGGIGVYGHTGGIAVFGMIGPAPTTRFEPGVSGVAVYGFSKDGPVAVFDSDKKNNDKNAPLALFRIDLGDGGGFHNVARIDPDGKGWFNGGTQMGGADVAECIASREALCPGDLVEIDRDCAGRFRLTATPYSSAVAGVVSTNPAVTINGTDAIDEFGGNRPRLALAGCVPVKVTAENGPIHPGDLLVASSAPGRAMRAPPNPAPGTIVGKALGSLEKGDGMIEMLVMLR